jgi:hypothetical protein
MNGSSRLVDAEDARHAIGALWTPGSSALNTRQGLRPGPGSPGLVAATGTPGANVTVQAFQGGLPATRGTNNPPYIVTEPAQITVPILDVPADPSNQRNDLIIYRQLDTYYSDPSTLSGAIRVQGTPSATPADPSLAAYPDYIPLARVRVTAGATTITNAMIDDLRPGWVVALGGVLPVKSLTDRATLTHWAGFTIYRLDKGWHETSDGAAWRIRGLVTVAALADVTDPYSGQLVILSTDSMLYRWTGSAWLGVLHTAVNGGHAKYKRTSAQANAFVAATWVRQAFDVAVNTSADVVPNGSSDQFTLQRGGTWDIDASVRANITNVAAMRYQLGIFPGASPGTSAYKVTTVNEPLADTNSTNLAVAVRRRFAAGDIICIAGIRTGNSGGGGGNNAASEANSTDEGWCQLDLRWVGP